MSHQTDYRAKFKALLDRWLTEALNPRAGSGQPPLPRTIRLAMLTVDGAEIDEYLPSDITALDDGVQLEYGLPGAAVNVAIHDERVEISVFDLDRDDDLVIRIPTTLCNVDPPTTKIQEQPHAP